MCYVTNIALKEFDDVRKIWCGFTLPNIALIVGIRRFKLSKIGKYFDADQINSLKIVELLSFKLLTS